MRYLAQSGNNSAHISASFIQAWCAMANCFSLQKEHDQAIKYLERAIQVRFRMIEYKSRLFRDLIYDTGKINDVVLF